MLVVIMKLSAQRQRFCEEYIIDLDGNAAAIRAGYSSKTARFKASDLLKIPTVRKEVNRLKKLRSDRTDITADKVLGVIAGAAYSNIQDMFDKHGHLLNIHDLPREVAAQIASIEVVTKTMPGQGDTVEVEYIHKIKMVSQENSRRDLGKHLKLFTDVHEFKDVAPMRVELVFVKGKK